LKIGEFAKRSGITIKTLLHYDKIDLLKPSSKSDTGYRFYCEEDFLKLQQIATLKFIGLSLSEIKQILSQSGEALQSIISIQKKALEEKKKHIETVISVLGKVENQKNEYGLLDVDKLIDIIKITNMENKIIEQYKTVDNFNLRGKLHSYNINKTDWSTWCFSKMNFKDKARILEIGCGTGEFWINNIKNVSEQWNITLSDFSEAMLKSSQEKLKGFQYNITYKVIDVQDIPFEDESFDVVIARHMLYCVADIEKALIEIKRVLAKDGLFYATTNSRDAMCELNELVESFDPGIGLSNNGLCERFDLENGEPLLKKHFSEVKTEVLHGEILVPYAEPIVEYKASTVYGSSILVGEKKKAFTKYIETILRDKGDISITTKACIFEIRK
jgi:ubiquinone/menaquinone biosynthesis C-methylase UbiE